MIIHESDEKIKSLDVLSAYSVRGWRVFPVLGIFNGRCRCGNADCKSPGKHPIAHLAPHGWKDATDELAVIQDWANRAPGCNWGIVTGRACDLVVLDIDPRHGGDATLATLEKKYGKLPPTLTVATGGGGLHLYYKYPPDAYIRSNAGQIGPGIDVRAEKAYVVAPPSVHISGRRYAWVSGDPMRDEPAELPAWLVSLLSSPRDRRSEGKRKTTEVIPEGRRNNTLTSIAGQLRRAGLDTQEMLNALRAVNREKCDPPLDDVEVQKIANSVARYAPGYALSDGGNAEWFADRFAGQVCYRHDVRRWYVWRSPVWQPDRDGEIMRLALQAVRERQAQALNIQDTERRQKTMLFLLRSENGQRLRAMIEIAQSMPTLAKTGDEFDRHDMLLAVRNGVLDLETGTFRDGKPTDYLTKRAGAHYDPTAKAVRWERFISEIFNGDADLIAFARRLIGYTLTGLTREQIFVFCHGVGRNGKSTLFDVLRALLGDYAQNTPFHTFTRPRGENGHEDDLMSLEGARLVTALESRTVATLAEDTLKLLAGCDPITGSRKHEHTHTYTPKFKVWLAANNLPKVTDVTDGFWRKVVLLPFTVRFEGARAEKDLPARLRAELPGILNWAITGCGEYLREGLHPPARCIEAVSAWRADNDPLADFLATCKVGEGLEVQASVLYNTYVQFCQANGLKQVTMHAFSPLVEAHGFRRERRKNARLFVGIAP
jgi:putative DNA primase/helicase